MFEPKREGKPMVVLLNNDGCVISRSAKAKALGVNMGATWHQLHMFAKDIGLIAYSSNYALYPDMSDRVMLVLGMYFLLSPE